MSVALAFEYPIDTSPTGSFSSIKSHLSMNWQMFVWNSFPEFQRWSVDGLRRHNNIIHGVIFGCSEKPVDRRKWHKTNWELSTSFPSLRRAENVCQVQHIEKNLFNGAGSFLAKHFLTPLHRPHRIGLWQGHIRSNARKKFDQKPHWHEHCQSVIPDMVFVMPTPDIDPRSMRSEPGMLSCSFQTRSARQHRRHLQTARLSFRHSSQARAAGQPSWHW
jgi:hypothetical protein